MINILIAALLVTATVPGSSQNATTDDAAAVKSTLSSYKNAIERLDTTGINRLFVSNSIVVESGNIEGRIDEYLAHHLGPELNEFKSFAFSDYNVSVVVDVPYAFATETYKYTIVLKKDGSTIARKGVATSVLKKEGGTWKIWKTHSSARK
ncbi:MAG: nuclear transport factor 2 family protein [Ignavibacteria bacterium]|nr:nuclear transport factor 2 family protein [Ignavibacteria bacterium]